MANDDQRSNNRFYRPGKPVKFKNRFRGFLPVVVDVETGGFDSNSDALLEIAAILLEYHAGVIQPAARFSTHVVPFEGANIDEKSLEITGIDPYHPLRAARTERAALEYICKPIRAAIRTHECSRAILVGHNAFFDLSFVNAAVARTGYKHNPFHPFSSLDTVSLSAMVYGQTVLARALDAAGIPWESSEAHSAVYDTEKTAELFCTIINNWETLNIGNDVSEL
ncbi:MAG: ribonuclease T [Gammaproteobacteria bacterium]|nr:ribonuclease T [Gammaproteobacteria bacterium]